MRILNTIKRHPLLFSFIVPVIVMAVYFFAVRKVYPFGNGSVLTVDMGQQYVDFYAYFRQTVLGHPGQFLFGWSKDLGGDMIGVWAYYLMSPFNFITVLFPKTMLDLAITVMTLAKIGTASLTMTYFIKRRGQSGLILPLYGFSYAMCGWMIANQLNLMWFDGAILLPLVAEGVHSLFDRRPAKYALWLTIALITNYYMGYMICLFIVGYFLFILFRESRTGQEIRTALFRFTTGSLLAGGLAACLLLPTFFQLTQSKGTYTVEKISANWEYSPFNILSKLYSGSFNFDQMPSGLPNIFIGSIVTLGVVLYFITGKISIRERVLAGIWTAFLVVSMMFEPLDLLWHGFQFPVWYPYRFSFVVCFWFIVLAARALVHVVDGIDIGKMLVLTAFVIGATVYIWINVGDFNYLTTNTVLLSGIFGLLGIILLSTKNDRRMLTCLLISLFALVDMTTNAVLSLNQIGYVTHSDYHTYTEALRDGVTLVTNHDRGTYRIGKTVLRTKNDAMQIGYMGEDQFNSMFEPAVPKFFAKIGQPEGDGFVVYSSGTLLTDALLDTKYWLSGNSLSTTMLAGTLLPASSTRPDLDYYKTIGKTRYLTAHQNDNALGLAYAASSKILTTHLTSSNPLTNQESIVAGLTGRKYQQLFSIVNPSHITLTDVTGNSAGISTAYQIKAPHKSGSVTYTFKATSSDPYYLTVGSAFTDNAVNITLNGKKITTYDTFRNTVVLNVTPTEIGTTQELKFSFSKAIDFANVYLYRVNSAKANTAMTQLRQNPMTITKKTDNSLAGTINIPKHHQTLVTSIPKIDGWKVTVDGHAVTPHKVMGLFMAIPLAKGQHVIKMTYVPPYLLLGLKISAVAFLLALIYLLPRPHRGRHAASNRLRRSK